MNDNLPPMPPCAPEFKPRWPNDPGGYNEDQMKAYARAAIERQSVPAGWMLVPIEPSEAMTDATYAGQHCSDIWRDMLAAAPQPQPVQESEYCDPSSTIYKLAEMVMSDCGHSTNNQRLLDRIAERIEKHTEAVRAELAAAPQPQTVQEQCPECDGTGTVSGSQAHFLCPLCTSPQEAQPLSDAKKAELDRMAKYTSTITQSEIQEADGDRGITKGTT